MFIRTRLFLLTLLTLSTIGLPQNALAQTGDNTQTEEIPNAAASLFRRDFYGVEFLDEPFDSISKFTLRLSSYGTLSGCASMTKPYVATKTTLDTTSIEVTDSEIRLGNDLPRYSNYDCDVKHNRSTFDVVLDRDELIKNKTGFLKLTSEKYGEFSTSEIEVTKEKFLLKIKTDNGMIHMTYWFLPNNTVILSAPYAKADADIRPQLNRFAALKGLRALEKHFDGYLPANHVKNKIIYVDELDLLIKRIDDLNTPQIVGQIEPTRTIYGVNGPEEETYTLDVYASVPKQSAVLIKR